MTRLATSLAAPNLVDADANEVDDRARRAPNSRGRELDRALLCLERETPT